jgi:hypothetical protein
MKVKGATPQKMAMERMALSARPGTGWYTSPTRAGAGG